MKNSSAIFVIVILSILFNSASIEASLVNNQSKKTPVDVEHFQGKMIILGTEGGIVNMRNETIILESGEVYYHNNVVPEYKLLKVLKKEQTDDVFKLMKKTGFPVMPFNHPGKMSTFLQYWNGGKIIRDFAWGEPGKETPKILEDVYTGIINIIK